MAEFQNTIDLLGDEVVAASLVNRTITEFSDCVITSFGNGAFRNCSALKSVNAPNVTSIGVSSFHACSALISADFTNLTNIASSAFNGCSSLTTLILRSTTVCTLAHTGALGNTPFAAGKAGGTVYCPASLITQYQTATNWSTLYAAGTCNFVAIEGSEYE